MTLPPDLVIFDCDGVLVDSEPLANKVLQANLARYGLDIDLEEIVLLFVGGTMAGAGEKAREMGAALPADWEASINRDIYAVLAKEVELVPGIVEVLDLLDQAGIPFAVGSNGPHAKIAVTLGRTGLMPRFTGRIVSREDVVRPKPAPDVYLKAAKGAGIDPAHCVVIEDSPSGARAAKAAGMRCFGYVAETRPDRLAPLCDQLFERMADLPRLLSLQSSA